MNYEQFVKIVNSLQEVSKQVNKTTGIIQQSFFNKHNLLVSNLLEAIYQPQAITYILYEWLIGNRSPLTVTHDGVEVIYPLNTVHDVWVAMEMYPATEEIKNLTIEVDNRN